jgi:hypothetical protein
MAPRLSGPRQVSGAVGQADLQAVEASGEGVRSATERRPGRCSAGAGLIACS